MSKADYIITDITGAHFPGVLPYRGPDSRRGYRTREEAETRARGRRGDAVTTDPHDIVTETLSFTREVRDRLRACGESKGPLVERLLREHWGMQPRPDVSQRGRWKPGQDPRAGKR